jgi:predicted naringenin-chalcone synthase
MEPSTAPRSGKFNDKVGVRLAAVATAVPPYESDQREAEAFFVRHFSHRLKTRSLVLLRKFLAHPSIRRRRFAVDSPDCLVAESPDQKIQRFARWAVALSARAAREALARAGLDAPEVTALVVNTCTGYLCPGLSSYLLEELGLPRNLRAYDLVGCGCGGAIPNLQAGADFLTAAGGGAALCVSVEICSATLQVDDDPGLLLSNALFADGAAAAVLWTRPAGRELVASGSLHQPEDREAIRYVHRRGQLYNQLARNLPQIVDRAVARTVLGVLETQGLTPADVHHWALHGGGEKVITAVARQLGLPEDRLLPTRQTLARFGNMSSPSVLFTLREILDNGLQPGDWCLMASFGAGLSAHALLLRS